MLPESALLVLGADCLLKLKSDELVYDTVGDFMIDAALRLAYINGENL